MGDAAIYIEEKGYGFPVVVIVEVEHFVSQRSEGRAAKSREGLDIFEGWTAICAK